jgi:uncharacterized protein (TIGR00297 family)
MGLLLAALISALSLASGLLTRGGSVAQFLLGWLLLGLGGWQWTVPVLVFFVPSSLLSRISRGRRQSAESQFAKPGARDGLQVLANGGVVGLLLLLDLLAPSPTWYLGALGGVGAAAADTWGTEIGILSRSHPRLLSTLKAVEAGRSGAVSLLGLFAALLGGLLVSSSGLLWIPSGSLLVAVAATSAGSLFGSLVDSLLGATLQASYRCTVCGKLTEREVHCNVRSRLSGGYRFFTNDLVNFLCTLSGALFALLLWNL